MDVSVGRWVVVVGREWAAGLEVNVCAAELRSVAALLSVAAPLSLYNQSHLYRCFYCGRWFCSAFHRLAALFCVSTHEYLSEKAKRKDRMRDT